MLKWIFFIDVFIGQPNVKLTILLQDFNTHVELKLLISLFTEIVHGTVVHLY